MPEDILVQRLSRRLICGIAGTTAVAAVTKCAKCGGALVQRSDDLDVIGERLRVYAKGHPASIVEFYRRRPTFRSVDGDQTEDQVAADISSAIASVEGIRR